MSEINMRQIEVFLAVAKYQNISKAAREVWASQPAVSNWIAKMEEYCGFRLFNRTNRGVVLTPEGEDLYARLDIAYHRFRVSVEEICNSHAGDDRTLRIGILNRKDAQAAAEEHIKTFSAANPDIPIVGERFNFHELRDKILCEELDLIFSVSADIEPYPEFDYIPVCDFPAFFIAQKKPEGDKSKDTDQYELSGKPLIIEAPTLRTWAENICREYGVVPPAVKYVNSYLLMKVLVARGKGFSIDGEMMNEEISECETVSLPVSRSQNIKVVMAWRKEDPSPLAKLFTEYVTDAQKHQI